MKSFQSYISNKNINEDLLLVIKSIINSCIQIEDKIINSAFENLHGELNNQINTSGDIQKKLDVVSNEIMIDNLTNTNQCAILLSEENDDAIIINLNNKYIVTFDPLDGSSNIDCNCCIGTIFSIYENSDKLTNVNDKILRSGKDIICAGYVLYGPACELVITIGSNNGVQRFILDKRNPMEKEFKYYGEITLCDKIKKIYSINESGYENWNDDLKKYIQLYKVKGTSYTQRYIGSMVADVHRTLIYGGMFSYPSDKKNLNGKLRLVYECGPMSKIVEEAGGESIVTDLSLTKILDLVPNQIHQKTSILLGSKEEVDKYKVIAKSMC